MCLECALALPIHAGDLCDACWAAGWLAEVFGPRGEVVCDGARKLPFMVCDFEIESREFPKADLSRTISDPHFLTQTFTQTPWDHRENRPFSHNCSHS